MLQEEYEVYRTQALPYQQGPSASVGVLDDPAVTHAPTEQDTSQPPSYPPGPKTSAPPQKRPGRGGAILLLALVLALIFGVGLFAGWQFAGGSRSGTSTTAKVVTTTSATSTGTTIETQQEAAIAK